MSAAAKTGVTEGHGHALDFSPKALASDGLLTCKQKIEKMYSKSLTLALFQSIFLCIRLPRMTRSSVILPHL